MLTKIGDCEGQKSRKIYGFDMQFWKLSDPLWINWDRSVIFFVKHSIRPTYMLMCAADSLKMSTQFVTVRSSYVHK